MNLFKNYFPFNKVLQKRNVHNDFSKPFGELFIKNTIDLGTISSEFIIEKRNIKQSIVTKGLVI